MDLNLQDLGATISLGVFTFLGVFSLAYLYGFMQPFLSKPVAGGRVGQGDESDSEVGEGPGSIIQMMNNYTVIAAAGIIACSYITGLVLEDLSDLMIEEIRDGKTILPDLLSKRLQTDDEIRFNVFFREEFNDKNRDDWRLAKDFAHFGLLGKLAGKDGRLIEQLWPPDAARAVDPQDAAAISNEALNKAAQGSARSVYYAAKNWCYAQENYYEELSKIQQRINFTRGLIVGSMILQGASMFFFAAVMCLMILHLVLGARMRERGQTRAGGGMLARLDGLALPCKPSAAVVTFVVVSVWWLTSYYVVLVPVFKFEEEQFNKRVYGYYLSNIQDEVEVRPYKSGAQR